MYPLHFKRQRQKSSKKMDWSLDCNEENSVDQDQNIKMLCSGINDSSSVLFEDNENNHEAADIQSTNLEGDGTTLSNHDSVQIVGHRIKEDGELEYLIKKSNESYRKCFWIGSNEINDIPFSSRSLRKYHYTFPRENPPKQFYDSDNEKIDKIITIEGNKCLVKWKKLDYDKCTWENLDSLNDSDEDKQKIEEFKKENELPNDYQESQKYDPSNFKEVRDIEKSKNNKKVKDYQLDGLNFLIKCFCNNICPILADEMGLGKTLQTALFLKYLFEHGIKGPFLIVSSISTIPHWEREINEWSDLKILVFSGLKEKRECIKKYEMFYKNTTIPKFHVFLTNYAKINKEIDIIKSIHWKCVVIDEAHKLKNNNSKLINCLKSLNVDFKLLITGTPVQNNLQELWSLLNYLNPNKFSSFEDFENLYGKKNPKSIKELQNLLKTMLLRRCKYDVEKGIAPIEEVIIECPMTPIQSFCYEAIYKKNLWYLDMGKMKSNINLNNISMQLRKVCNHPFLIKGVEEKVLNERRQQLKDESLEDIENEIIITSAGKMILLDKLLTNLKKHGHHVLIFSQMTKVLDLMCDYLDYKKWSYEILDGRVKAEERQNSIDRFNAPNSEDFVFLLLTKAGGVGINLVSADTVIIYDSDWNPQNDLQAISRCHRIGQVNKVCVYRFVTSNSYENLILNKAQLKLGFDLAVLEEKSQNIEEMDKLLRIGAYYALEKQNNIEQYYSYNIDEIINKSKKITYNNISEYSLRSKAVFVLNDNEIPNEIKEPKYWEKIAEKNKKPNKSTENFADKEYSNYENNDNEIHGYIEYWTEPIFKNFLNNLLIYGCDRWREIIVKSNLECELEEIKLIWKIILKWLLQEVKIKNVDEFNNCIFKSYNFDSTTYNMYEFKLNNLFKENFYDLIVSDASNKLKRLEFLYILNKCISTCPKKPDEIIIPEIKDTPTNKWTVNDDRNLLFCIWKNGYENYKDFSLENGEQLPNKEELTKRVDLIISKIKDIVFQYVTDNNIRNFHFDYKLLLTSKYSCTFNEHKIIINKLIEFGYPGLKIFLDACGFDEKKHKNIEKYILNIISYCKNKTPEELISTITNNKISKILIRLKFFENIREFQKSSEFSNITKDEDKELINFICKNGLKIDESFFQKMFDNELSEQTIMNKVIEIYRSSNYSPINSAPLASNINNEIPSINLPLQIKASLILISLGKVVYDRPNFHCQRYLYTDGFITERLFMSIFNHKEKIWYRSMIIDRGGEDPVFRVEVKDEPTKFFEGSVPSKPWMKILSLINKKRSKKQTSISGPEAFGLSNPKIIQLLSNLPNAELCTKYSPQIMINKDEISLINEEQQQNYDNNKNPQNEKENPKQNSEIKENKKPNKILQINFSEILEQIRIENKDE